jgi:hypothetical protein
MTREQLAKHIETDCAEILSLFQYKNTDYGAKEHAFANFSEAARRILQPKLPDLTETELMWLVAQIYVQKHQIALEHTGVQGEEAASRLLDIAVYCLIMRGMLKNG